MSLSILSIGVTGIIAMQKVTATSNQHAKDLAMATEVATAWMEQLRADAVGWNHPSSTRTTSDHTTDTLWLGSVINNNRDWTRPTWSDARQFGPGFDGQGLPIDTTSSTANVRFCSHLRLSWLVPPGAATGTSQSANLMMRAEVRVFWLREGQSPDDAAFCAEDPAVVGDATDRYHFVYNVTALVQNRAL